MNEDIKQTESKAVCERRMVRNQFQNRRRYEKTRNRASKMKSVGSLETQQYSCVCYTSTYAELPKHQDREFSVCKQQEDTEVQRGELFETDTWKNVRRGKTCNIVSWLQWHV